MTQDFIDIASRLGYEPQRLYDKFKEAVEDIKEGKTKPWVQVYKELGIDIKCLHCETVVVDFEDDFVDFSNMHVDPQFCVLCEECAVIYEENQECPYR